MDVQRIQGEAVADVSRGTKVSAEDMAIAAAGDDALHADLVVLLSWLMPLPSLLLQLLWLVLTVVAAFWNAGWRARTAVEGGE